MRYAEIVKATNEILAQYAVRLTVRQIYYRLISPPYQLFENLAKNYKAFDRLLTKARERGDVDWRRIEDRARTTIGGEEGYSNPEEFFDRMLSIDPAWYSRRLWENQPECVEVWVEKDALASLVSEVASRWGVLTFPTRGYPSLTHLMEAIERFEEAGKPVEILHFADHDPSGINMTEDLKRRLELYGAEGVSVERVALTHDQVQSLGLAPNPTKRADSRTPAYLAEFGDRCWELDALPPNELQTVVRQAIEKHIDRDLWAEGLDLAQREGEAIARAIVSTKPELERVKTVLLNRVKSELRLVEHV
jgi:hypothetical protein